MKRQVCFQIRSGIFWYIALGILSSVFTMNMKGTTAETKRVGREIPGVTQNYRN